MKIIIENRDINDPSETKEIEPLGLDLEAWSETPVPVARSPDFSEVIGLAVAAADVANDKEWQRQKMREAQADFEAGQKVLADKIKAATGLSVGYKKPWVYKAKPKVAYGLWKRVVPMFLERPETLDMGATALVAMLAPNEHNYKINRDMLYDALNRYAVADLKRMLQQHGKSLRLSSPVSIRSMQKELVEQREARREDLETEKFAGRFEIRGDAAFVNGKPYKIQTGASGKPRIKRDGEWLSLDALRAFCRKGE